MNSIVKKELQDWFFVFTCAPACLCLGVCRSHRRCPEPVGRLRFSAFGSRRAFALFSFWFASGLCAFYLLYRVGLLRFLAFGSRRQLRPRAALSNLVLY